MGGTADKILKLFIDGRNFFTEALKSTKSNPPSKVAKSAFMGTLIEQPPQAKIRPKAKYLGAHMIANDKTII